MITRLYLDKCFRHFDRTFTFEKGLTGVIGPNESGKSLIVEMIRYALFGSKALRGKAEDYKKLHVELDFQVNGDSYTVVRKGAKATLAGATQASGTRPVDEAIRRILGYDLVVFDVANACNQGNIEALSNMRPAERKKMVDQTVGLNVLDHLIKEAGNEGNALKREAEALQGTLVEPVEPEPLADYVPSQEFKTALEKAKADQKEYNTLAGYLARAPKAPTPPKTIEITETSQELQDAQETRKTLQRSIASLRGQRKAIPPEEWSAAELDTIEDQVEKANTWRAKQQLLAKGYHECPACEHQWPVADLGELAAAEPAEHPGWTPQQIAEHRARVGNTNRLAALDQALGEMEDTLDGFPDKEGDLQEVLRYEAAVAAYQRNFQAYEAYNEGLAEKQARFDELGDVESKVSKLEQELRISEQFERDLVLYEKSAATYAERVQLIEETTFKAEDFLKAREAIQTLKVSVKSHLLPSLNKVASVLLSRMTGGERYLVEVDEDFEILIDGQPINTLSGSGKAVANLAIRIALGQILTNRVFSIFLADEVDAAMDDERAEHTSQALRRLTDSVGQVVLVTHKRPETDHMVELKRT